MAKKTTTKKEKLPIDTSFQQFSEFFGKQMADKDRKIADLTAQIENLKKDKSRKSALENNQKLREKNNLYKAKLAKIEEIIKATKIEDIGEIKTIKEQQEPQEQPQA